MGRHSKTVPLYNQARVRKDSRINQKAESHPPRKECHINERRDSVTVTRRNVGSRDSVEECIHSEAGSHRLEKTKISRLRLRETL